MGTPGAHWGGGEVSVGLRGGACVPRVSPQMPPEPGWPQHQHPDLHLDQVHLRPWQEIHRYRLRDLTLRLPPSRLGGTGRPQPHRSGALGCPSLRTPRVGQDSSPPVRWTAPGPAWGRTEVAVARVEAARGGRQQPRQPRYHRVMHRPVAAGEQGAERDLQWKGAPPSEINTDPGRRRIHFLGVGDPAFAVLPQGTCHGQQQLCKPPPLPSPTARVGVGTPGCCQIAFPLGPPPSSPSPPLILPHRCLYTRVCTRTKSAGLFPSIRDPKKLPPTHTVLSPPSQDNPPADEGCTGKCVQGNILNTLFPRRCTCTQCPGSFGDPRGQ